MNDVVTKDMYLAAALLAYGSTITKVDRTDPHRQYFHFDKLPERVQIENFMGGISEVKVGSLEEIQSYQMAYKLWFPPHFVSCLRSVKAYLYQE